MRARRGQEVRAGRPFTERYSLLFLGARTLESFRDFGDPAGRSPASRSPTGTSNYFHEGWEHLAGHQACLAHLIRDFQDAAETLPGRDLAGAGAAGAAPA